MNPLATYLLKVSLAITVVYIAYILFLRKRAAFKLNRTFLLGGLLLSFIIPVVPVTLTSRATPEVNQLLDFNALPLEGAYSTITQTSLQYLPWLSFAYLVGVVVALVPLIHSILWIHSTRKQSSTAIVHGQRAFIGSPLPFSFFGQMFLPSPQIHPAIVDHEHAHIEQKHWIDLIIIELACVVLWFNPIIYLYRRAVVLQHEYLADEAAVSKHGEETYLTTMVSQLSPMLPAFTHFHSKSIKQRITMITQPQSSSKAVYWITLPLVAILFTGFVNYKTVITDPTPNLQGAPSIPPVDLTKVKPGGAGFGIRMHPVLQKEVMHTGIDFILPIGEPVVATLDGVVVESSFDELRGNFITIRHNDTFSTSYFHLDQNVVKTGQRVKQGQTIGQVGNTGNSTGPHLHYEVRKNGVAVEPLVR